MPRAVTSASLGTVRALDRPTAADAVLTEEDAKDPAKLARAVAKLQRDVARLVREAPQKRTDQVDVTVGGNGESVRIPHHYNGRVRWSVVGWRQTLSSVGDPIGNSFWVARTLRGPGTLASIAGDYTVGSRFQVTSKTRISGARFPWVSSGNTRTVTATLWRDSDGATLASGTVSVNSSGVYLAPFTTPVDILGANLNTNLTIGVRDGGFNYTKTGTDSVFTALLPFLFPGGISLQDLRLYSAGAARPTSNAATELYWCEPWISPAGPGLVEDTTTTGTDANVLALKSYVPGVATIRIERAD